MPDPSNTTLIEFKDWTLRVRETSNQSPRFLLMIHGLTGDEDSMWVFARNIPADYWIVAPRAPYTAEPGGYSWRLPQFENMNRVSLDLLRSAAESLIHLVDEYSASVEIDATTFDVMGFSQGAAMSNVLAFLYPQRIRKTGILAGFVPDGLEELVPQRPLQRKPFFVTHGTRDDMVSVDQARASVKILEQAGANVTYCEDDVAHKVSVNCLHALKDFFADY
jgi:phospholipase/carboxylesterase